MRRVKEERAMKIKNEVKVGLLVITALGLLAALTFKVENFQMRKAHQEVRVRFRDINGVNLNSPVMFNGYEVGKVSEIRIVNQNGSTRLELTLSLDENVRLRQGTKVYVKNLGLMGEKYVGLVSLDANAPILPPGTVLKGEEPANFEKLVQNGEVIADQIKEIAQNINDRLEKNKENVDAIFQGLNDVLSQVHRIARQLDERLEVNREHIDRMMMHLDETSQNLEEMSQDLKQHPWKLLYKGK